MPDHCIAQEPIFTALSALPLSGWSAERLSYVAHVDLTHSGGKLALEGLGVLWPFRRKAQGAPGRWVGDIIVDVSKVRIVLQRGPSQAVKDLGAEIERQYGIKPLADGESRPDGYYTPNHYTARGLRPIKQPQR
jgi:hypothetical protein